MLPHLMLMVIKTVHERDAKYILQFTTRIEVYIDTDILLLYSLRK